MFAVAGVARGVKQLINRHMPRNVRSLFHIIRFNLRNENMFTLNPDIERVYFLPLHDALPIASRISLRSPQMGQSTALRSGFKSNTTHGVAQRWHLNVPLI